MTCIMAACAYLSWTGNRPRPVCHIHAPYPSSSARPAHPCLGYCASSPPPSPPSWNQTDKNLNCRPPTSRLCPVCHIHVPYPSSPARPPHPCIGYRAPPSPTSPPVYAQVTQTYFLFFCSGSDSSKHGVLRQRYSATGPHDAPGGPTQAKKIVTKLRGAKKQRLT